jgi:uncharacterized protein
MPTTTEHKHGTFSWADLGTTDADAAKRFYGGLFGWTFEDMPAGPGMTYAMCKLNGKDVGALYKMGPEMKGMPPHWAAYVTVDNVDERTKKVTANGGKVMKEPFDVMDVGRMSVVQDPSGGTICLWQGKKHHGASVMREPGALCWAELFTTNVDAAGKFYVNTIGWKTETMDMGPMGTYTLFSRPNEGKEGGVGGMMAMPPNMKGVPSHWLNYFQVTDVDASAKKVNELGGKTIMPPTDIPNIGRFSICQDPQGAHFALYKNAH